MIVNQLPKLHCGEGYVRVYLSVCMLKSLYDVCMLKFGVLHA